MNIHAKVMIKKILTAVFILTFFVVFEGQTLKAEYNDGENAEIIKNKAEQGDKEAQFKLGNMYYFGKGIPLDYQEAAKWFMEAAKQGHKEAQFTLGNMYYFGLGVRLDCNSAAKWFSEAAERGDQKAQFGLGNLYYNGEGVPKDYDAAAKWFKKAADQGFREAQYGLGNLYYKGEGVSRDDKEAAKWFRKAADQGFREAQYGLGNLYYKGEGVPRDDKEAAKWFRKAADQGFKEAQFGLGSLYYKGEGVPQDDKEAAKWFAKAAEQGDQEAQMALNTIQGTKAIQEKSLIQQASPSMSAGHQFKDKSSESQFILPGDFREIKWGMNLDEIKKIEGSDFEEIREDAKDRTKGAYADKSSLIILYKRKLFDYEFNIKYYFYSDKLSLVIYDAKGLHGMLEFLNPSISESLTRKYGAPIVRQRIINNVTLYEFLYADTKSNTLIQYLPATVQYGDQAVVIYSPFDSEEQKKK